MLPVAEVGARTTSEARSEGFLCVCISAVTFFKPLVTSAPKFNWAKSSARDFWAADSASTVPLFTSANKSPMGIGGGAGPAGGGACALPLLLLCIASPPTQSHHFQLYNGFTWYNGFHIQRYNIVYCYQFVDYFVHYFFASSTISIILCRRSILLQK